MVKYNSTGVKQWTRQLETSSSDEAYGITIDSSGNVHVKGYINRISSRVGDLDGTDIIVVKYDNDGNKQ